jgi:N-methylhydantoinase B
MNNTPASMDPFTLEVVRHAFSAIAEEMSLVVMRSARSPLLREAGDLSSAITDTQGELVAQGRDIPMHMGVMSFTVKEFLKRVPVERLSAGDVWFLNLPEIGGNHLPDVKAVRPVFADGVLRAFAVSLAHWADIGGAIPGSYVPTATDAWQEGLRLPPVRLFSEGGPDREKLDLVLANVRGAPEREGDILAQTAATRVADERLQALCARHGGDNIALAMRSLHDHAEAQMRAALKNLPAGTYHGEDWLDDDAAGGEPVPIRVRIVLDGDRALFDFSESGDAARGPVNTTPFIAAASVFYAVKALVGADIQANGGCYRPLEVITRPGSVLEPGPDRPVVGGNHETSQRVADAIFRALEPAVPELLTAGGPTTSGLDNFRSAVVCRSARRRRLDHALRNPRRRRGRPLPSRRRAGDPRAHVQCHEHARRGDRGRVSGAYRKPAPAPWLRRGGCPPGWRRVVPGVSNTGRADVVDQHVRARRGAALRTAGRRARRAVSGYCHPGER